MLSKSLAVAALALGIAVSAHASPVTIGTAIPGTGLSFPFGATTAGTAPFEYQQVYTGTAFSGTSEILGFSFSTGAFANPAGATLNGGTYTITLSTSNNPVSGLSSTLADNIGANRTTVFTGALPALVGGTLSFTLPTAFTYDPTAGDLLLDVTASQISTSATPIFFDATDNGDTSRLYGTGIADDRGLVTTFAVPEPVSVALLGAGLVGLVAARRRSV